MNKQLFSDLPLDLKADFVFQKGSFIGHREYGLKYAIYKCEKFYAEVVIGYDEKIQDIILANEEYLRRIGMV